MQDDIALAVKLIDAQFPPYEQVIPKDHKKVITVDRARFIDALRRAQLMSSETRGVKVAATKEGITITSDNPDLGEVREELDADYNGEPIAIGFNPKYVVELLGQMASDQITLRARWRARPRARRADSAATTTSASSCRCASERARADRASSVHSPSGVRNLRPLTLAPRERFNVFVGDNGQGKTNLLEAIYAVAALRSFRTASWPT